MDHDPAFDSSVLARHARQKGVLAFFGPKDGSGSVDTAEPTATAPMHPGPGLLWVRGRDADSFLQGQVTNAAASLRPGEGNLNARANRKGALVEWFSLHRLSEGSTSNAFVLALEASGVQALAEDLLSYRITEAVEIFDGQQIYDLVLLLGPSSRALLRRGFASMGMPGEIELGAFGVYCFPAKHAEDASLLLSRPVFGVENYLLALHRRTGNPQAWRAALNEAARIEGVRCLSPREAAQVEEIFRIESGWPRMGVDLQRGGRAVPELGLSAKLVDPNKGCYLGQEIIARMRSRDSAARILRGLIVHGDRPLSERLNNLPFEGSDLVLEGGETVGTLGSRTFSPLLDEVIALGHLQRAWQTPGQRVRFRGKRWDFDTELVSLPFEAPAGEVERAPRLHEEALSLFASGRDEEAIECLEECLRADPSFADAYEALGVLLGRAGRYEEAITIFHRLESVAPLEPLVHTNLSLFYMQLGEKEKAEEEKAKATVKQFARFGD